MKDKNNPDWIKTMQAGARGAEISMTIKKGNSGNPEYVKILEKGLLAIQVLINESQGVFGLDLINDDLTYWESLRTGGIREDWLIEFDNALDAIEKGIEND